jgi:hypothetical protein
VGTKRIGTGPAWTNDTTRGTGAGTSELQRLNGIWTNRYALTARNGATTYSVAANRATYLGSFRTTATAGQTEDSGGGASVPARRLIWNAYNRVARHASVTEVASSWAYATSTWRRGNANPNLQIEFLAGLAEDELEFGGVMGCTSTATPANALGLDWVGGVPDNRCLFSFGAANGAYGTVSPSLRGAPLLGYHTVVWLELGGSGATFYGTGAGGAWNCGINGRVMA